MSKIKKETQHIHAYARLRPFNKQEHDVHSQMALEIVGKDITVKLAHGSKKYTFDKVFDCKAGQQEVYMTIINPMIEEVLLGYNCTVFAYGQTGSGKTYTMVGNPAPSYQINHTIDSDAGIIPRTLGHIFERLGENDELDFTIRVSYLEIYNEILIDLLSSHDKILKIYEDPKNKGSIQVHGLEEVTVYDKNEVFKILQKGSEKRITAATLMNSQSSRSHTVFTITLHSRESTPEGEELVKTGKLNLVDLAGSENIMRSGAIDKRAREAGSINQSLLTLGRVIKALVEKQGHVPYRESKLTRILQDSLGGRTKTTMIATVSPASINIEETMSTLDYAFRARNIVIRPEVNQRLSKTALIQRYLEDIDRLKKDLNAARTGDGVYLDSDNYNMMVEESEQVRNELLKSVEECATFEGRAQELARMRDELEQVHLITKSELDAASSSLTRTKNNIRELRKERRVHQGLLDKYEDAQTGLRSHVQVLTDALDERVDELQRLQNKVETFYETTKRNKYSSKQFLNTFSVKQKNIMDNTQDLINREYNERINQIQSRLLTYFNECNVVTKKLQDNMLKMQIDLSLNKIQKEANTHLNSTLMDLVVKKQLSKDVAIEIRKLFDEKQTASNTTIEQMTHYVESYLQQTKTHMKHYDDTFEAIYVQISDDFLELQTIGEHLNAATRIQFENLTKLAKDAVKAKEHYEEARINAKHEIETNIQQFENSLQTFVQKHISDLKNATVEKLDSMDTKPLTVTLESVLQGTEVASKQLINTSKRNSENVLSKMNKLKERHNTLMSSNQAIANQNILIHKEITNAMETVQLENNKYTEVIEKLEKSVIHDDFLDAIEDRAKQDNQQIIHYIEDVHVVTDNYIKSKVNALTNFNHMRRREECAVGESFESLSNVLSERATSIAKDSNDIIDEVTAFIKQDLDYVEPTGSTPMKKPDPLILQVPKQVSRKALIKYKHLDQNLSILNEDVGNCDSESDMDIENISVLNSSDIITDD